jgi:zinc transporter ZupT
MVCVVAPAFVCIGIVATLLLEQITVSITQHQHLSYNDKGQQGEEDELDQFVDIREATQLLSAPHSCDRPNMVRYGATNNVDPHEKCHHGRLDRSGYPDLGAGFSADREGRASGSVIRLDPRLTAATSEKNEASQRRLTRSSYALARTIVLETSVFIHSMIIGFGLGSTSQIGILRVLTLALCCHQFFEGISLGSMILETELSDSVKYVFAYIFAVSLPTGACIGLVVSHVLASSPSNGGVEGHTNREEDLVTGAANAVAAGSLLYTCLVEIVHEEFRHCWVPVDTDEDETNASLNTVSTETVNDGIELIRVSSTASANNFMLKSGVNKDPAPTSAAPVGQQEGPLHQPESSQTERWVEEIPLRPYAMLSPGPVLLESKKKRRKRHKSVVVEMIVALSCGAGIMALLAVYA